MLQCPLSSLWRCRYCIICLLMTRSISLQNSWLWRERQKMGVSRQEWNGNGFTFLYRHLCILKKMRLILADNWAFKQRHAQGNIYLFISRTSVLGRKMASLSTSSTTNKPAVNSAQFSWQTISSIMNGLTIFVKCLCISLCVGYLLSFSRTALDVLTVSPGRLMPPNFWIWTILTHSVVEVFIGYCLLQ